MPLPPRLRLGHFISLLWDLAPWPFSAYLSYDAIKDLYSTGWLRELACIFMMIVVPAASAVWLQFRMAPRIHRLAPRERREEMAVTPLPARDYLLPRLRAPICGLLLPGVVNWLALAAFFFKRGGLNNDGRDAVIVASFLALGISSAALSVRGSFGLLIRLCRSGAASDARILLPILWTILALALPYGGAALLVTLADNGHTNPDVSLGVILGYNLVLTCVAVRSAFVAWKKAVIAYYTFE